jgi:hypothetical protein
MQDANPVIRAARQENAEMARTHQKLKSSFYGPYSMSMKETVNFFLNKPQFGMENYEPRRTHENLIQPHAYKQQRFKRETFMVSVPKVTDYVPAPCKYETTYDWKTKKPDHT